MTFVSMSLVEVRAMETGAISSGSLPVMNWVSRHTSVSSLTCGWLNIINCLRPVKYIIVLSQSNNILLS